MTITIPNQAEVWFDAVAKVCADIVGVRAVFAGGRGGIEPASGRPVIQPMIDEELMVTPAAVLYAGDWEVVGSSGQDQVTHELQLLIWIEGQPIGTAYAEAVAFRQRIMAAFPPHMKAYEHVPELQWVKLLGGGGIEARRWPENTERSYLVVPASLEVRVNDSVRYQPA